MTPDTDIDIDFFVLGAQKCATSWLFYCLREHPQASLPRFKREEHHFGGAVHQAKGDHWFFGLYDHQPAQRNGSVSVEYLVDPAALTLVLERFPRARLVASLREPLARAASAHAFLVRKNQLPAESPDAALSRALDQLENPAAERTLHLELMTRGLYGRQLQALAATRALDRLCVLGFERLCQDPAGSLRRLYAFLGLVPDFVPPSFGRRPKRSANWPLLTAIERSAPESRAVGKIMDHANQWLCRLGLDRQRQHFSAEVAARARAHFAKDAWLLSSLLAGLPAAQNLLGGEPAVIWNLNEA